MKLFAALSAVALLVVVSTAPTPGEPSNFEVDVPVPASFPPIGGVPMVIEGDEIMRDIEGDNEMLMVDIVIDVWQDSDGRGRHEGLWSTLQKCYNLGNGWNDQISSLSVPTGFGCNFHRDNDCVGGRLTVPGGNYVPNLGTYDFNDIISSYRCYN